MEMDAGRKFNSKKFMKWINHNYKFIMKKLPRTRKDLSLLNATTNV
jgi:hypothetical protein